MFQSQYYQTLPKTNTCNICKYSITLHCIGLCLIYMFFSPIGQEYPFLQVSRWLGGAMVLGKLPVPGRPSKLADSRARAYCACSGCGWGCLDIFTLIYLFSPLSPSLWETARYRLKYCLKGLFNLKQPTNQQHLQVSEIFLSRPAILA